MKVKYKAFLSDKESHKVVIAIEISSDGYMTALADAHKLCASNHPNLYVARVIKE
jgi:hypothetical protein